MAGATSKNINSRDAYYRFINGITCTRHTDYVSFWIRIPQYMPDIEMGVSFYEGWSFTVLYTMTESQPKHRTLHVTHVISTQDAFNFAFKIREEIQSTFKLYRNATQSYKRKK